MKKKIEPGMAYDMEKLNKVFAFLAVVFLITVFWVFLDDYTRPWKQYQLEALQIKNQKISENVKKAQAEIDQGKLEKINKQIEAGKVAADKKKKQSEQLRISLGSTNVI